jgi:hypothetical protein
MVCETTAAAARDDWYIYVHGHTPQLCLLLNGTAAKQLYTVLPRQMYAYMCMLIHGGSSSCCAQAC